MTARTCYVLLLSVVWLVPVQVAAAEWGGITPGETDIESVRERYGVPSRELRQKLEGYDTLQWIYEGAKAPQGFFRIEVGFGLLTASGYRPRLVRYFRLDPRPGVFTKKIILVGWGNPSQVGREKEQEVFYYKSGLVVHFDEQELNARSLLFIIPQPDAPASR